jgi:hypothetical protein
MRIPHLALLSCLTVVPCNGGVWAHYPFDTDYTDSSANAQHGTLTDVGTTGNSGIITSAGDFKFGNGAMNFSADRDFVAIPAKTFSSGVPYTIAFWARKSAGDTGQSADWDMVIGDVNNTNFFIALNDVTGTGLRWRSSSSAADRQADFAVTKDYEWHHYAVVASGTTITLYVDGSLFGSATGKLTGFTFNSIGEAYTTAADFDFNGQIDEMWIFDEALSAARISALCNSNDADSVPAYGGFHHKYDGDFTDSNGTNHGTASGTASITTDPAAIASGTGSLSLDGADDSHVSLATPGAFNANSPWTATWWARRGETGGQKGMVMGTSNSTTDFIWLNDNFTGLRFRSSADTTLDFTTPKDQQLRHYALVADGAGNLALYLDGQLSETLTGTTSFAIDSIGRAYPTTSLHYNFQGILDEVHVIPSALNSSQIAQLHDSEKPVAPVTRLRIVLVAGQSNADGRAVVSELPTSPVNLQNPQNDVDLFYRFEGGTATLTTLRPGLTETSQFGPDILLGRRLANLHRAETGTRVAIIRYANGGTNLNSQWKGGGDGSTTGDGPEYLTFQQTVTQGLAALAAAYPLATRELQSIVWLQGESDSVAGLSSLYQANLTTFIADVRATYGVSLPFVIARLSSKQTALATTNLNEVRAAQDSVAAADPRTAIINTDSFGIKSDNLHFNGSGQQSIGSAFAEETAYYEWMVRTFTATDITAGLAEPDADRDGDGQPNRSEFLAATDPLTGTSVFQSALNLTTPGAGVISYPSSASRVYTVEHYLEANGTWETILPALPGTGSTVVRTLNSSESRGIFRVRSELP